MKATMIIFAVCFLIQGAFASNGGNEKHIIQDMGKGLQKITWYHDNGTIAEQGFYLNGQKHGTWLTFNDNGAKVAEANYNNNLKDGSCFVLHNNGKVRYEIIYSNNKKVKATEYDTLGNVVASH